MLSEILQSIGAELDAYNQKTVTSYRFAMDIDNGDPVYRITNESLSPIAMEFKDASVLVAFLADINTNIDPAGSITARHRLETLKAEQIKRDGEIAALEKTIVDLPDTQLILNAKAEAAARIQEANDRLAVLADQLVAKEEAATAKEEEIAVAESAINT